MAYNETTKQWENNSPVTVADMNKVAIKGNIANGDIASNAEIAVSKISGLGSLATKSSIANNDVATQALSLWRIGITARCSLAEE